jgi:hypothetical protein
MLGKKLFSYEGKYALAFEKIALSHRRGREFAKSIIVGCSMLSTCLSWAIMEL